MTEARLLSAMMLMVPQGCLWTVVFMEEMRLMILLKLSPAPRTHVDREEWLRDYMGVDIHIHGYNAH